MTNEITVSNTEWSLIAEGPLSGFITNDQQYEVKVIASHTLPDSSINVGHYVTATGKYFNIPSGTNIYARIPSYGYQYDLDGYVTLTLDKLISGNSGGIDSIPLTAFGDLRVAQLTPQFQGSFEYTVDNTELTTNTEVGSGTVTQGNAMAIASTGTTTGSKAKLLSKRHARYKSGLGGLLRFTAIFTPPVAGTVQYIGLADEEGSTSTFMNGLVIGYDESGVFGFHRFANDTKYTYPITDWPDPLDGSGASGMVYDPEKLNVFAIRYQYLGGGAIQLLVEDDATGKLETKYEILYANKNTAPSVYNPNFHYTILADNGATTDDLTINSASYAYFVEGPTKYQELQQPGFPSGEFTKSGVKTEVPLFTIRNKSTYASKTNFIDILLKRISGSVSASNANNQATVKLVKNGSLTGASFSDINTTDSVVEIDSSATAVSGGKEVISFPLASQYDKFIEALGELELIYEAGDSITVTIQSTATSTFKASLSWRELF